MEFWHNRWDKQQIGWHKTVFNELLVKHWSSIKANPGCEIIVPLCGKSLDMLWLANQGHTVVGLEMVDQAVKAFFSDNKLAYSSTKTNAHTKFHWPSLNQVVEHQLYPVRLLVLQLAPLLVVVQD